MAPDDEISLFDLVQSLLENWKSIAVAALLGVLLEVGAWWLKGYEAEIKAKPVAPLDFVEWRRIVVGLPALAESRALAATSSGGDDRFYQTLSKGEWWSKNVLPQYRYAKGDIKDLAGIAKEEQERGATIIESLLFRGKGGDRAEAIALAAGVENFVREGGLMMALKSIVERLDLTGRRVTAEVQAKISRDEVELGYLQKRAAMLKKLAQQYPDKQQNAFQLVLDPKGEAARFLPLSTQLIAVETAINGLEESLSRSRDRLEVARITNAFVERALPLVRSDTEGFVLAKKLMQIEAEVRKAIDPANKAQLAAIDELANELNSHYQRFKSLFEADLMASVRRPALGLFLALGLLGGGLAGILFFFVRTAWRRTRREHEASGAA